MEKQMTKAELRELRRNRILQRGMAFKKTLVMDYECEDLGEEEIISVDKNGIVLDSDKEEYIEATCNVIEEVEDNE